MLLASGETFIEQRQGKIEMGSKLAQRKRVHSIEALGHQLTQLAKLRMYLGIVQVQARTTAQRHFLPPDEVEIAERIIARLSTRSCAGRPEMVRYATITESFPEVRRRWRAA
jgi:hypothetical protein